MLLTQPVVRIVASQAREGKHYLNSLSTGADCRYWSSDGVRKTVVELTELLNELEVLGPLGLWLLIKMKKEQFGVLGNMVLCIETKSDDTTFIMKLY